MILLDLALERERRQGVPPFQLAAENNSGSSKADLAGDDCDIKKLLIQK